MEVQGSLTLKRLKKGLNVILSLECTSGTLYQGYNDTSKEVSPDWTIEANQPVVTPKAIASDGSATDITTGTWKYNNTTLIFSVADNTTDSWITATNNAAFQYQPSTKALKIVRNLASASNVVNDTLEFQCSGEAGTTSFDAAASITVHLQPVGSSTAAVYVTAAPQTLTSSNTTSTLTAHFYISGKEQTSGQYWLKWTDEAGKELAKGEISTTRTCAVTRADITAIGGAYCYVYADSGYQTAICSDFVKIIDTADDYELEVVCDKEWDGTNEQTVTAKLYKFEDGKVTTEATIPSSATVTHELKTSISNADIATKTGVSIKVGSTEWTKAGENEDIVDFVSVNM